MSTRVAPRKKKRNYDELKYLRATCAALEAEVKRLYAKAAPCESDLGWEAIARRQASESHSALQENSRLKATVETQLQLARSLEQLLLQHGPATAEPDAWYDEAQLPVRIFERAAAMHRRLDDAFSRLEATLIRHNILDIRTGSFAYVTVGDEPHDVLSLTSTRVAAWTEPMASVADRVWRVLTTDLVTPEITLQRLETVDANTIYYHFHVASEGLPLFRCNYGLKRYLQPHATTFVIRSMGYDPVHPPSPCTWTSDDTILIHLGHGLTPADTVVRHVLALRIPYVDVLTSESVLESELTMSELLLGSFARTNCLMEVLLGYQDPRA
ncbi:hypothetical protein SPRG_04661 [Saprolegnia parasitica CBS 223.65]|uniref:START domain-containing protein n=1 Tax=Saprolegnia parasitica (strain CBS 223.65) TaxID=695850 RepID=A0A067CNF9_SAPPC|nr:hypothetical protein SPRG_04661 [Saprolegnia parasitica CBS 223.65]KDO30760.1 hypothetical protein SPRG_04661 [Saprolegnia parasitica CBS 223.65]|eukprot:XP_012198459.1 hypothetical protein SPRG_04661 [Saprolegnia parasitica CBS 223.65]